MKKIFSVISLLISLVSFSKTPIFCCGFECGVAGAHWTLGASSSFSTTTVRSGTRSLRINPSAATTGIATITSGIINTQTLVFRFYFRHNGALGGNTMPIAGLPSSQGDAGVWLLGGTKLGCGRIGSAPNGITIVADTWYCVDVKIVTSANPWTIDVSVNGVNDTQLTNPIAAITPTSIKFGYDGSANTADYFIEDVLISQTSADYPLGPGKVEHYVPTADGTHNGLGANEFERTLTGTDITGATTDAYQLVDDVPLESGAGTDFINMVAPSAVTDYVEVIFGPAPGISVPNEPPRTVELITGSRQAGTGAGNMTIWINDNGTTVNHVTRTGVAGVTTIQYFRNHWASPPAASSWSIVPGNGNFKDIRIRFGSMSNGSVDANPDQYLTCAMIEAEFAEAPKAGKSLSSLGVGEPLPDPLPTNFPLKK